MIGPLAQLVEQETLNLCVIGSRPIRPMLKIKSTAYILSLEIHPEILPLISLFLLYSTKPNSTKIQGPLAITFT